MWYSNSSPWIIIITQNRLSLVNYYYWLLLFFKQCVVMHTKYELCTRASSGSLCDKYKYLCLTGNMRVQYGNGSCNVTDLQEQDSVSVKVQLLKVYIKVRYLMCFSFWSITCISDAYKIFFLYFIFNSCVFSLLVLLLWRQISPWGLIKYISIYLSNASLQTKHQLVGIESDFEILC